MINRQRTRVFVMEGKWEKFLPARRSAAYLIHLLEDAGAIRAEFDDTLRRRHLRRAFEHWGRTSIPIGYLAAHGERGSVFVGGMNDASLADIAHWIGDNKGKSRVLLLGTCLSLGSPRQAQDLVDETGLTALFGYRRAVDTVHAAVWETLLVDVLARSHRRGWFEVGALRRQVQSLVSQHPTLTSDLGFVSVWKG